MSETTSTDTAPVAKQSGKKHPLLLALNTPVGHLLRGRVTGPVHRRTKAEPEQRTELSAEAERLIDRVVKRTRLWPSEKREVNAELVAHFADGYEAGHTTDELIESFGDPVRSAKLIRRAKRRCRPLWWQTMRYGRNVFGVFVGLYILLAGYLLLGENEPEVNYLAKLNAESRSVPEDERAWPLYVQAGLALNADPLHEHHSALGKNDRIDELPYPGEPGWEAVSAYLDDHAASLDLVERGARKAELGFVVGRQFTPTECRLFDLEVEKAEQYAFDWREESLVAVLLPHLSSMRDQHTLMLLRARRAAMRGGPDQAMRSIDLALRMAEHVHGPFLIDQLVAVTLANRTFEEVGRLIQRDPKAFDDGQLRNLAHRLAAVNHSLQLDFTGERYFLKDVIQRIYTDGWLGSGHVNLAGMDQLLQMFNLSQRMDRVYDGSPALFHAIEGAAMPAMAVWMAPRNEMERKTEQLYSKMGVVTREPMWRWDELWNEGPGEVFHFLTQSSMLTEWRYALIKQLMPSLSRAAEVAEHARAKRDAVLVAIALEIHRRRNGSWPEALDEMTPHLLPEVPPDRFTGEPMQYVLRDGDPLLYSVGIDRDDDGGRLPAGRTDNSPAADRNERARSWLAPDRWKQSKRDGDLPDGDWILWPAPEG